MTYEQSFLNVCDDDGLAPCWAIEQIFAEHGVDLAEFQAAHGGDWEYGETILTYLGY